MTENIPEARFIPMTSLAKAVGPLDGRGNLPLYQELQRALRKAIDSRLLGPGGWAIEFSQSFYRGDTYDFVAELSTST